MIAFGKWLANRIAGEKKMGGKNKKKKRKQHKNRTRASTIGVRKPIR
jgi:hypothetical protein